MLWARDGLPPCGQEDRAGAPASNVQARARGRAAAPGVQEPSLRVCVHPVLGQAEGTKGWGDQGVAPREEGAGRALSFLEHQARGWTPAVAVRSGEPAEYHGRSCRRLVPGPVGLS